MKDSSLLFRIDVYNLAIHNVNAIGRYFAGSLGSSVVLDLDNNFTIPTLHLDGIVLLCQHSLKRLKSAAIRQGHFLKIAYGI